MAAPTPTCVVCVPPTSLTPTLVIAGVSLVAFVWLLVDAIRNRGWRWASTLVGGFLFGFVVEWTNTHTGSGHIYCYPQLPDPVANAILDPFGVPIWVALGWGSVIYAASWTGQRLRLSPLGQAIAAAFLAVSVDFSLDPVAELFGFWKWECFPVSFCGVPYDNFIGWYLIVFVYALMTPYVLGWFARHWQTPPGQPPPPRSVLVEWVIPLVCAAVASAVLIGAKALIGSLTSLGADNGKTAAAIFIGLTVAGGFVTFYLGRQTVTLPVSTVNLPVIVVPVVIHVTCYLLFLSTGFTFSPFAFVGWTAQPMLVASIPVQLLGGLFVFTTPWRR